MATKKGQRIAIWVIAGALVIGTLGGFAVLILAPKNQAIDEVRAKQLMEEYTTANAERQKKVDAQAKELSATYYATFQQYESRVAPFDSASVTELKTEDVVVGDGEEIDESSSFTAYYIGWNPSGTVFDSSIKDGALVAPIAVRPGGVIQGWTKGAAGMKIGGIRELTIPANLAYGAQAQGDDIPANTPLKFIIMIIPTPEAIPETPVSDELMKYYTSGAY